MSTTTAQRSTTFVFSSENSNSGKRKAAGICVSISEGLRGGVSRPYSGNQTGERKWQTKI